jgi:hypothetical protein
LIDVKSLRDVFDWNLDSKSAFLAIKPDLMSRGMLAQTAEFFERVVKAARGAEVDGGDAKKE